MEFTEKRNPMSRNRAHQMIDGFLKGYTYQAGQSNLYADFTSDPSCNQPIRQLLMGDCSNRCCYCMRKISSTTLEHVILRSITDKGKYDKYFVIVSDLERQDMKMEASIASHIGPHTPYPHTIAYENLIPSCFGHLASKDSKCCNLYRGEKFVHPLTFREDIHNEVKYYNDGSIEWTAEPGDDPDGVLTLSKLGLDCLELTIIRRIWFYMASHGLSPKTADKEELIYDLIDLSTNNDEDEMIMQFKKPEYWRLISEYDYFNNINLFTLR